MHYAEGICLDRFTRAFAVSRAEWETVEPAPLLAPGGGKREIRGRLNARIAELAQGGTRDPRGQRRAEQLGISTMRGAQPWSGWRPRSLNRA